MSEVIRILYSSFEFGAMGPDFTKSDTCLKIRSANCNVYISYIFRGVRKRAYQRAFEWNSKRSGWRRGERYGNRHRKLNTLTHTEKYLTK